MGAVQAKIPTHLAPIHFFRHYLLFLKPLKHLQKKMLILLNAMFIVPHKVIRLQLIMTAWRDWPSGMSALVRSRCSRC